MGLFRQRQSLVPDAIRPILGYRAWVRGGGANGLSLESVYKPARWPLRGPLEAECLRSPRGMDPTRYARHGPRIPHEGCGCGIYGLFIPTATQVSRQVAASRLREAMLSNFTDLPGHYILGVAAGWGRVVLGTAGWRAEMARPVCLFHPPPASPIADDEVRQIAAAYEVPVLE